MNINRLNYENYFLLYVDGELSASEMQAVESFAAENDDLADELDMLLQTKLPDENNFLFENKSTLLRTTSNHINSINYEERFLLFVDGELSDQAQIETLNFVSDHPQYQDAFDAIMQTKLPDELTLYPNKESLYREEEKRKPVFYMQWQKLAIAAALIGIVVMVGVLVPRNNGTEIVKTKQVDNSKIINSIPLKQEPSVENVVKDQGLAIEIVNKSIGAERTNKNIAELNANLENTIAKTDVNTPKEEEATIALNTNTLSNTPANITEANIHTNIIAPASTQTEPTYVRPAVYKELDTEDDRKSLYVGAIEINKDKFRGFLRKASSLFKGKNKNEEEKTEISNSHSLE
jgi:hypothetical protein